VYSQVTTSGSDNAEMSDDVMATSRDGGRAHRLMTSRVYDWNTKQHFYPDIIDSDSDWSTAGAGGQCVRWNSGRWRAGVNAGRCVASGVSSGPSQPQTITSTRLADHPQTRAAIHDHFTIT